MTERKRRDYPWRRSHRRLLVIVFGFAGTVALALVVLNWQGESALEKQVAAIRAKGEPITPADLERRYPAPPKEENAADTYGKAGETLQAALVDKEFQAKLGKVSDTAPQERFAEELHRWMEGFLADHAEELRILHAAAGKPACRYHLDLGRGFDAPLPNLLQVRGSAQLLQLEAYVAAEDGDSARAADAIAAALALDGPLRQAPVLIMQMIRVACRSMACRTVKRVLPVAAFSEEQLAQLQAAFARTDVPECLTNAFIGERAMGLTAFNQPQRIIPQLKEADLWLPGASSVAAGFIRMSTAANGDRERYLRLMTGMIDASRLPTHEALAMMKDTGDETRPRRSLLPSLTDQIMPNMWRFETQQARSDADLRCAVAALAAERHRLANGSAPARASDLVPAFLSSVPVDPFDGQPLRYFADAAGYAFYSVGENRLDENGKDVPRGADGDLVFRVAHPS